MKNIFRQIAFAILLATLALPLLSLQASAEHHEFMPLKKFREIHPMETEKAHRFDKIVSSPVTRKLDYRPKVKVGVIIPGKQISDYWRRSVSSFKSRLEEYGIELFMKTYFMNTGDDIRDQSKVFKHALMDNPDYLVLTLDTIRHQRMVAPLLLKKKPKVILQNITTPLESWEGKQPFMYIGFDHTKGAIMLARHFLKLPLKKGKYLALLPDPGYLYQTRGLEFIRYMENNSEGLKPVVYHTGISSSKARKATLDALRKNPNPSFIYAASTDIALGAVKALKEKGLNGKIPLNGWGGGKSELEAITRKEIQMTVMRINDDNGVAMADAIAMDLEGKTNQVPKVFCGKMILIDDRTPAQRIRSLEQKSFRYSRMQQD